MTNFSTFEEPLMSDIFTLTYPRMNLSFKEIITFINSVYILQVKNLFI